MSGSPKNSISIWTARHSFFVWMGVVLNLLFVVPLLYDPIWLLGLFNLPLNQPLWARFAGLLLLIISVYYIPATIDLERYRVNAWLAIIPSRSFGAIFFCLAVFVFDEPPGFIVGILLDGSVGLVTLYCLIRVTKLEHAQRSTGMRTFGGDT
jgi:hypothetical protein